jgi:hypothetical protein
VQLIDQNREQLIRLCRMSEVNKLFAFGSIVKGTFGKDSDLDFVVELLDTDPLTYADHYFSLKFGLQDVFKRPIDLLESKAIKNAHIASEIDKTKVLVYER